MNDASRNEGPENTGRSPAFRAARRALLVAEKRLPHQAYAGLYRTAYTVYKAGVKTSYRRELAGYRDAKRWPAVRRAEAVSRALRYSLVGPEGLEKTYDVVANALASGVPGSIVECGVAQGGSSAVMAIAMKDVGEWRHLWLFDSFEGLPDPTSEDFDRSSGETGAHIRPLPKGSCLGTVEEVDELMSGYLGLSHDRFTMVPGWFQDTVHAKAEEVGQIAVLRLDGDWYESTKVCLEAFYDNVSNAGTVVIDDYHSCYGSKRAVDEFLEHRGLSLSCLTNDGSGGVYFHKGHSN